MLPPHRRTPEALVLPKELTSLAEHTPPMCGMPSADSNSATSHLLLPGSESEAVAHFDLVIIGGGPAALAVVSRILESRPAALYTEDEHRHLHFVHRQRTRSFVPKKSHKSTRFDANTERSVLGDDEAACACEGSFKILVIDRCGEGFMGLWKRNFNALGISHLRSPMFFHPDASDFDALLAYANQTERANEGTPDQLIDQIESRVAAGRVVGQEAKRRSKRSTSVPSDRAHGSLPHLIEIPSVVGREKSKHKRKQQQQLLGKSGPASVHVNERDRRDYFTPSSALFGCFIRRLEEKYGLKTAAVWPGVQQFFNASASGNQEAQQEQPVTTLHGSVKDLVWLDGVQRCVDDGLGNHRAGFLLELEDNDPVKNGSVVVSAKAVVSAIGAGGKPSIPPFLTQANNAGDSGSGTGKSTASAPRGKGWMHSGCLAWEPFPIPRQGHRSTMVVVGGGLTSAQLVVRALESGYDRVILLVRGHLKSKPFDVDLGWVGRYSNYLRMQFWQSDSVDERVNILRTARNGGSVTPTYAKLLSRLEALGKLEIRTHTTVASATYDQDWTLNLRTAHGTQEIRADYVIAATGAETNFRNLTFLSTLQRTHPVSVVAGMPLVTADLEYRRDVPLFVTGAYAALQIGPGAGNLGMMRDSADRIANRLVQLIDPPQSQPARRQTTARSQVESAAPTHFNFDLLSIEA
ncbi:hypothetical protein PANT_5d00091 [Moesziomyces antarcticus T-34]|uniref:Uncharacterized protein n=1 Tax=Pseudozyma antarctica (strain T-34) TaxID=1151754 RepID=M9LXX0_PSEA3|nr:hypothetical protein PANT_5d00091 [Moesziomyces antarcticus T-34]